MACLKTSNSDVTQASMEIRLKTKPGGLESTFDSLDEIVQIWRNQKLRNVI